MTSAAVRMPRLPRPGLRAVARGALRAVARHCLRAVARPSPVRLRAAGRNAAVLAAALLALPLAAPRAADWQAPATWPAPERGPPGEPVTFPSSSPFTPADAATAPPTAAVGTLYRPPAEPRRNGRVPAVVMLHGAGGVLPAREHAYGRQFAQLGVVALVVDVFGARRDRATGFSERLLEITESMAVADAYAALRFLRTLPEVDPQRVALIGFSYGGMASTYALNAGVAARFAPGGERFAAHVAYYGPCVARFAEPRTTGAPLLMLYGDDDALMVPERCADTVGELRGGGSAVDVIVYPGAAHQWDGGQPRRQLGRLLGECRFRLEADGTVRDERTGLGVSGPILRRIALFNCVQNEPYWIGANDAVRAQSNRDVATFLRRSFGAR